MKSFGLFFIFSLILNSCGGLSFSIGENTKGVKILKEMQETPPLEYRNQLSSLSTVFLNTPGIKRVRLRKSQREYLESIYRLIVNNNGILFTKVDIKPEFIIIKDNLPYTFSLPNGDIFLSTGIIKKYIKHELVLIALITSHIIRIHHGLYRKHKMFPVGYITLDKILSLMRLSVSVKHEIGKLSYFSMKRAGLDTTGYLMWIQVQNRNTLEFRLQLGDLRDISVEEFLYKKFIVKQGLKSDSSRFASNSSAGFYKLIKYFKRRY